MKQHLSALVCGFVVSFPMAAFAQKPPKDPEVEKQKEENERVELTIKRSLGPVETERDRFIKDVAKLAPPDPASEAGKADADLFFDRVAGGSEEWTLDVARKRNIRDLFERVASRLNVVDGRISRQQFREYAASYLRDGFSPPWRSPTYDEDRAFQELDRNKDSMIDVAEASAMLRSSMESVDANADGRVDRNEFASYFSARVQAELQRYEDLQKAKQAAVLATSAPTGANVTQPLPTQVTSRSSERQEAIRFGHLPRGTPDWFAMLDTDRDGQVGLYEWKHSAWPTTAFDALDANSDGLLTVDEWQRFAKDYPDEAALFQAQPTKSVSDDSRGMTSKKSKMR